VAEAETQTAIQPLAVGPHGEPCEACGSPMAFDQRYCLNCGVRRGDPRADYRSYMADAAPATGAGATPGPAEEQPEAASASGKQERDYAPLAAVGGIAVLGAMLLIGVLIGKGDNGGTTAAPPVQVVTRGEEEATPSTAAAGAGGSAAKKQASAAGAKSGAKKNGSAAAKTAAPPAASADSLESLNQSSGGSYEQESKNLPNEIATPGAPPPIDKSKAAGGGEGGGVTIE
jgi:hypothetical protein